MIFRVNYYRERKVIKDIGFSYIEKVYENKKTKVLICKK
jgi:hypothetical protein